MVQYLSRQKKTWCTHSVGVRRCSETVAKSWYMGNELKSKVVFERSVSLSAN